MVLQFTHPDWVSLQTRQQGLEGTGIPFDEALELAVTARDIEPPLLVSRLGLTARDRIAFADPLGCAIDQWHVRVRAVGLTATDDTRGARYVVTGDPNHGELNTLWSAGAMVIAEWAFESGLAELEEQCRRRNLVL